MKHFKELNLKKDIKLGRTKNLKTIFTLDLETYSNQETKEAHVYMWMFGVDEQIYYGRTLDELHDFMMAVAYHISGYEAFIYVHNLPYDFHFLLNIFSFEDVFARKERTPLKAKIRNTGFNLRCTYALSGLKLADLADTYDLGVNKLDYDYLKYRDSTTPLTDDEMRYCEHDCLIVYQYIKDVELPRWGELRFVPLTKTSKVRRDFKKHLGNSANFFSSDYRFVSAQGAERFTDFRKMFTGGYLYANLRYISTAERDVLVEDPVDSWDINSSYPYVMLTEGFPSGRFCKIDNPTFDDIRMTDCHIIKIRIKNFITLKDFPYLSLSKINTFDNLDHAYGRIYGGDMVELTCTEIDLEMIKKCYTFSSIEILELHSTSKARLPKKLITFILKKVKEKQQAKARYEAEPTAKNKRMYKQLKIDLNAVFGMMVTLTLRDDAFLDDSNNWQTIPMDINRLHHTIETNESQGNFDLFPYSWGVWVTSYARRNILDIVYSLNSDNDILYIDTDCLKFILRKNSDIRKAIKAYNAQTELKLKKCFERYSLSDEGFDYSLGQFKFEETYRNFKTLGPKKYIYINGKGVLKLVYSGIDPECVCSFNDITDFKSGFILAETRQNDVYYNNEQSGDHRFGVYMEPKIATLGELDVNTVDKINALYYEEL